MILHLRFIGFNQALKILSLHIFLLKYHRITMDKDLRMGIINSGDKI